MEFDDFNIDLYEDPNKNNNNGIDPQSSIIGTNSSSSFVCATLTNFTESCDIPCQGNGKVTIICK